MHPGDWLCLRCCACRTIEQVSANIECNAVSAVQVTHHFLKRMVSLMTVVMHRTLSPGAVQPWQICKAYKAAVFGRSKRAITADQQ
jgi:hypothetical protein